MRLTKYKDLAGIRTVAGNRSFTVSSTQPTSTVEYGELERKMRSSAGKNLISCAVKRSGGFVYLISVSQKIISQGRCSEPCSRGGRGGAYAVLDRLGTPLLSKHSI